METREMRLEKLQLVIDDADQAGQLDISGETNTARSLRTPEPPTDAARMALPKISDRLHVHSNSGREQNSAMYHIRGNAQWSGDQRHVRPQKVVMST